MRRLHHELWLQVQQKQMSVSGRIFIIENSRSRQMVKGNNNLKLKVNFMPEIITLAKEVRPSTRMAVNLNLLYLGNLP